MRIHYIKESKGIKNILIATVIILIIVSPWLYTIYLGNHVPLWLLILLSFLFALDFYVIFVEKLRDKLYSRVRENVVISDDTVVFDEPVDVEVGYCYSDHYVKIYTKNNKYMYSFKLFPSKVRFKTVKKLENVTRLPIPKGEFFAYINWHSDVVSGPGTKYLGRKLIKRFLAPAIRVTSGRYRGLVIIVFDNNFEMNVDKIDSRFQLTENSIIFHNDTGKVCKLKVYTSKTHEYLTYHIEPNSNMVLEFFPKEPFLILSSWKGLSYHSIIKILKKTIHNNGYVGSGEYYISCECGNDIISLKLTVMYFEN